MLFLCSIMVRHMLCNLLIFVSRPFTLANLAQ